MTIQDAFEEYKQFTNLITMYGVYGNTIPPDFYEWLSLKRYVIDED